MWWTQVTIRIWPLGAGTSLQVGRRLLNHWRKKSLWRKKNYTPNSLFRIRHRIFIEIPPSSLCFLSSGIFIDESRAFRTCPFHINQLLTFQKLTLPQMQGQISKGGSHPRKGTTLPSLNDPKAFCLSTLCDFGRFLAVNGSAAPGHRVRGKGGLCRGVSLCLQAKPRLVFTQDL